MGLLHKRGNPYFFYKGSEKTCRALNSNEAKKQMLFGHHLIGFPFSRDYFFKHSCLL